jgi:prevent-host-death family protein
MPVPTAPTQIGSSEAKAKFSELLRRVEQGERFVITLRGRKVAELAPPKNISDVEAFPAPQRFSEEEREAAYQRLRNPRITGISGDEILEWIRQGRKY